LKKGRGLVPGGISLISFLGDNDFVLADLHRLKALKGDLSEVSKKNKAALLFEKYAQLYEIPNDVIGAAYLSGGYTLKEVGDYFKLNYSRISKVMAKN
jgi:hypothetical protein